MSGYTADVIAYRGELEADVEYLQKPFTPDSLREEFERSWRRRRIPGPTLEMELDERGR